MLVLGWGTPPRCTSPRVHQLPSIIYVTWLELDGWQVFRTPGMEGPDTPPLDNTNRYLVHTQFGEHFAGKITSWLLADFTMGEVLEVPNAIFGVEHVDWRLSAYVQLHSRGGDTPYPANVHQVWEIGWNNDGSAPREYQRLRCLSDGCRN